ncbi:MAG: N-acetylmuramoyl-L-alanine amidase [Pseudomonadaceae bacterium]|nr:N-acetylmuramoyl-L-alanine amidase [Pseudomonadaceae bacterium]
MREIDEHVVHCSDSDQGNVVEIRRWHLARGWKDVGYHFVIRRDGEIEVGRTLETVGAHCEGFNSHSVGTCLIGRRDFTERQFAALRRIHAMLVALFPGIKAVGHRAHNPHKTCPNFEVSEVLA